MVQRKHAKPSSVPSTVLFVAQVHCVHNIVQFYLNALALMFHALSYYTYSIFRFQCNVVLLVLCPRTLTLKFVSIISVPFYVTVRFGVFSYYIRTDFTHFISAMLNVRVLRPESWYSRSLLST
jgi:hypothetical protein